MILKRLISFLGLVTLISIISFSVSLLVYAALSPELKKDNKSSEENIKRSFKETLTDIDEPKDIDLSLFAPFFYWGKGDNDQLVLTQYTKDYKDITYKSVTRNVEVRYDAPGIHAEKVSPKGNKLAFTVIEEEGDSIQIFDIETQKLKTYRARVTMKIAGGHLLNDNSWSPSSRYLYYLYSSDYEGDNNIWLIDINSESSKILLNGYDINVLGWIDDFQLAYYEYPRGNEQELGIYSIDVRNNAKKKVGYCDQLWLNKCLSAEYSFPEDSIIFPESANTTLIYVYNYINQSGVLLNDILYEEQFTRADIRSFSPDRRYMYFYIRESYTDKQPEKAGTYEYNLDGNYFRHISKDEYSFILWNKISSSSVLLKGRGKDENEYFLHEVESFDINPVEIPGKIVEFIN